MGASESKEGATEGGIVTVASFEPHPAPTATELATSPLLQQLAVLRAQAEQNAGVATTLPGGSSKDALGLQEYILNYATHAAADALSHDLSGVLSGYVSWSKEKAAQVSAAQTTVHESIRATEGKAIAAGRHLERMTQTANSIEVQLAPLLSLPSELQELTAWSARLTGQLASLRAAHATAQRKTFGAASSSNGGGAQSPMTAPASATAWPSQAPS